MGTHSCKPRVNTHLAYTSAQMFTHLPQTSNLYDKSNLTNQTCFPHLCDPKNIFRNEYTLSISM